MLSKLSSMLQPLTLTLVGVLIVGMLAPKPNSLPHPQIDNLTAGSVAGATATDATTKDPIQNNAPTSQPQTNGVPSTGINAGKKSDPNIPPTKTLVFSTSVLDLNVSGSLTVSADGVKIYQPKVLANGISAYPEDGPGPGQSTAKSSWTIYVSRPSVNSSGETYISVTALGGGANYSGSFLARWNPYPNFDIVKGAGTATSTPTSTIYTASFTIVPGAAIMGRTITVSFNGGQQCVASEPVKTIVYSGQNDYSLSCTKQKLFSEPGMPPPPTDTGVSITLTIDGGSGVMGGGTYYYGIAAP